MRLKDKTALVTGGARGIGRGIAEALAGEGASVAVADVDLEEAQKTVAGLPAPGARKHLAAEVDVADSASVERMLDTIRETWGALHVLVNNAGICPLHSFEEISEEEWDRVIAVNLKGAFLCSRRALPLLKEARGGRIINISSVAGKMGALVAGAHYAASKAGMMGLTWSLARYCAGFGITVNAVAPATVETELTASWSEEQRRALCSAVPLGRLGRPEDIAAAVVFLASPEAGYITGEVLDVNGGFRMD